MLHNRYIHSPHCHIASINNYWSQVWGCTNWGLFSPKNLLVNICEPWLCHYHGLCTTLNWALLPRRKLNNSPCWSFKIIPWIVKYTEKLFCKRNRDNQLGITKWFDIFLKMNRDEKNSGNLVGISRQFCQITMNYHITWFLNDHFITGQYKTWTADWV